MAENSKVLTIGEVADYLRVHPSTIYRLLKKGQLRAFKIGSDWRFNVEWIEQWRLSQGGGIGGIDSGESRSQGKRGGHDRRRLASQRANNLNPR